MTCLELLEKSKRDPVYYKWREELHSRVERVLALHSPFKLTGHHDMGQFCGHCSAETRAPWPCPTVRLLNGEEY